jgi:hypothetical protein
VKCDRSASHRLLVCLDHVADDIEQLARPLGIVQALPPVRPVPVAVLGTNGLRYCLAPLNGFDWCYFIALRRLGVPRAVARDLADPESS